MRTSTGPVAAAERPSFGKLSVSGPRARYVRLHGFETLRNRLDEIERAVTGSSVLERHRPSPLTEAFKSFSNTEMRVAADPLRHLREAIARISSESPHVVLVDDLDQKDCHELFGRLRDELWELPIQWVVAGVRVVARSSCRHLLRCCRRTPAAGPRGFVGTCAPTSVRSGTPEEGRLLASRVDGVIDKVAPCTPRRALSVLRDLYLSDDLAEATSQLADLQSARSSLKPTANRLLDALIHYGPTHAGDEELLAEVGVTPQPRRAIARRA